MSFKVVHLIKVKILWYAFYGRKSRSFNELGIKRMVTKNKTLLKNSETGQ